MRFASRFLLITISLLVLSTGTVTTQSPAGTSGAPARAAISSGDPIHRRALALLATMTVEEKAGQLNQAAGIVLPGLSPEKPDEAIRKGRVGSVLRSRPREGLSQRGHVRRVLGTRLVEQRPPGESRRGGEQQR